MKQFNRTHLPEFIKHNRKTYIPGPQTRYSILVNIINKGIITAKVFYNPDDIEPKELIKKDILPDKKEYNKIKQAYIAGFIRGRKKDDNLARLVAEEAFKMWINNQ